MKQIKIKMIVVIVLMISISYIKYPYIKEEKKKIEKEYIVSIKTKKNTIEEKLDDYLLGVVAGEMPAHFEEEAIKAQVVASRTYVMSRKLKVDNTTKTQVYLNDEEMKKKWKNNYDKYKSKIQKAIEDTHNEVITYNGEYISALFFASCNGKTNNCNDYFNGAKPYLKSVESQWDLYEDKNNQRKKIFHKKELCQIFKTKTLNIKIKSYNESDYVKEVMVNNKYYSGREIRELLGLASSSFQIIEKDNDYIFLTNGYGHGVGMSQYGAQGMAKENKTYKEILKYYYKNIKIESI